MGNSNFYMNYREEQIRFAKIKFSPDIMTYMSCECEKTMKIVNLMKIRWIHWNSPYQNTYENFFSSDIHKSKAFDYILMEKLYSCHLPLQWWNWLQKKTITSQVWDYVQMRLPNLPNADLNSGFFHLNAVVNGNTKTIDIHFTTRQLSTHSIEKGEEENNKLMLTAYISSLTTKNKIPTTLQDKKWILFNRCGFEPILTEVTVVFLSPHNLSLEFSEILVRTLKNVNFYQDIINIIQNFFMFCFGIEFLKTKRNRFSKNK